MVLSYNGITVKNSGFSLRYTVNRKKQVVELYVIFYSLCKTENFMCIFTCMQISVWGAWLAQASRAWDSWSQAHEFKIHVGHGAYLNN